MLPRFRSFPSALAREYLYAFLSYDTRSRPHLLCASRTRPSVMQASPRWWLERHRIKEELESQDDMLLFVLTCRCTQSSYNGPISFSPPQIAASAAGCGIPARSTSIGLICPVATRQFQTYCKPRLMSSTSVLCCLCPYLLC